MKKFLEAIGIGITQGIGICIVLSLFIVFDPMGTVYEPKRPKLKAKYEISEANYSNPRENKHGSLRTTVTFRVINHNLEFDDRAYFDVEFYGNEGEFVFGDNKGFVEYISPELEDNVSLEIEIPDSVDMEQVSTVTVKVYEVEI